jgi:elongation factor G
LTRRYGHQLHQGQQRAFGRILLMHANHREDIEKVYTGDIVAAVG